MISKFPTQTETSPQSRNLLMLTSLVLITDLTTMESREKVTIHLSKNKDSSVINWLFKFEIQVSKIYTNVSALTLPRARRYSSWYPRYLLTSSRLFCRNKSEEILNKSNLVPKTIGFDFYDLIAVAGIRSVRVTSSKWSVLKNIPLLLTLLIKSAVGAVVDQSL